MKLRTAAGLGLLAALMLAGCATPYGAKSLGGGYSDERIDDTHYLVRFDGNGYASQDRVWSFWIYRCAELTKQKGYAYFALSRPPAPKSSALPPEAGPRQRAVYREGDGVRLLPTKGATYVPIYVPGQKITTWHSNAVVGLHNEPLPENLVVWRAQSILDDLDAYIKSGGSGTPMARDELFRRAMVLRRRPGA